MFVCVSAADLAGTWSYKTVDGTKRTGDRVEEIRKTSESLLHFGLLSSIVNEALCLVKNAKKHDLRVIVFFCLNQGRWLIDVRSQAAGAQPVHRRDGRSLRLRPDEGAGGENGLVDQYASSESPQCHVYTSFKKSLEETRLEGF